MPKTLEPHAQPATMVKVMVLAPGSLVVPGLSGVVPALGGTRSGARGVARDARKRRAANSEREESESDRGG